MKALLHVLKVSLFVLIAISVASLIVVFLHSLPIPTYRCSVCHSTNISASYYEKRGFLSQQECFYCYNCQKAYNINLREEEK